MDKKMNRKKIVTVISVSVVIILLVIYFITVIAGNAKNEDEDMLLREYPVSRGNITAGTDGSGSLSMDGKSQNYDIPVKLEEVYVKQGDYVKVGDRIALASFEDLEQKLDELRVELKRSKIALTNAKNAKKAGALDSETGTESSSIQLEYETQRAQAQSEANEISINISANEAKIKKIDSRIAEIDSLLSSQSGGGAAAIDTAALKEERNALTEDKSDKEKELSVDKGRLSAANTSMKQLEKSKDHKLSEISKQSGINKQKKSIEAEDLSNGVTLAQIDVDEINKKIDQTEQLLSNLVLKADTDGIVLNVNYSDGNETTAEQPVASIGSDNGLFARLQVGQSDIVDIQEGQEVELSFDAFPGMTFKGNVIKKIVVPIKDSNPVAYQVNASVDKEDAELLPGMTCNAQFIIKQAEDVLMLSNKAIKMVDGKQVVSLRDEKGKLYEQIIETGFSDGKFSEVLSGLAEGQIVYVEG